MLQTICHAYVEDDKAVVELLYVSEDKKVINDKLSYYQEQFPEDYLAIYDLPVNVELNQLSHYPSIEISKEDFETSE